MSKENDFFFKKKKKTLEHVFIYKIQNYYHMHCEWFQISML